MRKASSDFLRSWRIFFFFIRCGTCMLHVIWCRKSPGWMEQTSNFVPETFLQTQFLRADSVRWFKLLLIGEVFEVTILGFVPIRGLHARLKLHTHKWTACFFFVGPLNILLCLPKHIHYVSKSLPKSVRCIVDEVLMSWPIFMNIGPSYSALSCESSYLKSIRTRQILL